MMTELSPAAQAVLAATHKAWVTDYDVHAVAAAVIRAAADQVVPREPAPDVAALERFERWDTRRWVRLQFFTIATELENAQ